MCWERYHPRMRSGCVSSPASDRQWPQLLLQLLQQLGPDQDAHTRYKHHAEGAMAGMFGKIFVGIYVEIKRSDGTFTHRHRSPSGGSGWEELTLPLASCCITIIFSTAFVCGYRVKACRLSVKAWKPTESPFIAMLLSTVSQVGARWPAELPGGRVRPPVRMSDSDWSEKWHMHCTTVPFLLFSLHHGRNPSSKRRAARTTPRCIIQQWPVMDGWMQRCTHGASPLSLHLISLAQIIACVETRFFFAVQKWVFNEWLGDENPNNLTACCWNSDACCHSHLL